MNSIFLILLLLCCCNHGDSESSCTECGPIGCPGQNARRGGCREREDDCPCRDDDRKGCDDNPFSPFGRGERRDNDYPEFRGSKGPCGCEDTVSSSSESQR